MYPKICIVDDEEGIREALSFYISETCPNAQIIAHNNAQSAVNQLSTGGPWNLLITDLKMPDMNGEELIRTLENKKTLPQNILFISGHLADVSQYLAGKKITFLSKPFRGNTFKATLHKILGPSKKDAPLDEVIHLVESKGEIFLQQSLDFIKAFLDSTIETYKKIINIDLIGQKGKIDPLGEQYKLISPGDYFSVSFFETQHLRGELVFTFENSFFAPYPNREYALIETLFSQLYSLTQQKLSQNIKILPMGTSLLLKGKEIEIVKDKHHRLFFPFSSPLGKICLELGLLRKTQPPKTQDSHD